MKDSRIKNGLAETRYRQQTLSTYVGDDKQPSDRRPGASGVGELPAGAVSTQKFRFLRVYHSDIAATVRSEAAE